MNAERKLSCPVTVCVVNYNGEQYLEETIGSIYVQREKFEEILLIDNASEDKSIEIVKDRFSAVKVIQLDGNHGPGAARNVGFRAALSDRILFMDNDVSLACDCPDRLSQALSENPHAAVAMPRILYAHNKHTIQYDGADCHFLGLMTLHNVNETLDICEDKTRKIGSVVTACFLVDRKKWGGGNPFDETFFIYFEDHDFGQRTRLLGHEILSVPSACCYHREGTKGLSFREGGNYSRVRIFYLIRNRQQLILKNYSLRTLVILSPFFFIYEIFQLAGVIKKGWFGEWLRAWFWTVLHLFEILRKRRMTQKARKTPDREILRGGVIPFTGGLIKTPLERMGKNCLDHLAAVYWKKIERYI